MRRALFLLSAFALGSAAHATTTYEVQATLDPAAGRARGRVVIRWTNETPAPVDRIPMAFTNPEGEELIGDATVDGETAAIEPSREDAAGGFDLVPAEPSATCARRSVAPISVGSSTSGTRPTRSSTTGWAR